MCGRFVVARASEDLVPLFEVDVVADDLPAPNWNIPPGTHIPVILDSDRSGERQRRLESAWWSLVPRFATEFRLPYPTFNARSETAASKPTFRASVASQRCLIPADGYYEWAALHGRAKAPQYIAPEDGTMLAFAGLYSWWRDPAGPDSEWRLTATILTRAAPASLELIHQRVPLLLASDLISDWLDPAQHGDQSLLDAVADRALPEYERLSFHEVAPLRGNGPELLLPVG